MRSALDDLVDEVVELGAGLSGTPSPALHRGPAKVQDQVSRDTEVTEALQVVGGIVNPSSVGGGAAAEVDGDDAAAANAGDAANAAVSASITSASVTSTSEETRQDIRRQSHGTGGEGDDERLSLRK